MSDNQRFMLKLGLEVAIKVSKQTPTVYDDIVVKAAVMILNKIFKLEMEF